MQERITSFSAVRGMTVASSYLIYILMEHPFPFSSVRRMTVTSSISHLYSSGIFMLLYLNDCLVMKCKNRNDHFPSRQSSNVLCCLMNNNDLIHMF